MYPLLELLICVALVWGLAIFLFIGILIILNLREAVKLVSAILYRIVSQLRCTNTIPGDLNVKKRGLEWHPRH